MPQGSPEHKAQFLQDLTKTLRENAWKEEIQILELEELLGTKRKEKAALNLELDQKGKPAANDQKKALAKLETDIESLEKAIEVKRADKVHWEQRIELIKRYEAA